MLGSTGSHASLWSDVVVVMRGRLHLTAVQVAEQAGNGRGAFTAVTSALPEKVRIRICVIRVGVRGACFFLACFSLNSAVFLPQLPPRCWRIPGRSWSRPTCSPMTLSPWTTRSKKVRLLFLLLLLLLLLRFQKTSSILEAIPFPFHAVSNVGMKYESEEIFRVLQKVWVHHTGAK